MEFGSNLLIAIFNTQAQKPKNVTKDSRAHLLKYLLASILSFAAGAAVMARWQINARPAEVGNRRVEPDLKYSASIEIKGRNIGGVSPSAEPVPESNSSRTVHVLRREESAHRDATTAVGTLRDSLWTLLGSQGMAFQDFEKVMTNMIEIQKLSYIADDAIFDLKKATNSIGILLRSSISSRGIDEFRIFEENLIPNAYAAEIAQRAKSENIGMDSELVSKLSALISSTGAHLPNAGGPFDPLFIPTYGEAETRDFGLKRAEKLDEGYRRLMEKIDSDFPPELKPIISSYYLKMIAIDRDQKLPSRDLLNDMMKRPLKP